MKTLTEQYIEKLEELVALLHNQLLKESKWDEIAVKINARLTSEIILLEKQVKEESIKDNIKDLLREYGCYGIDHNEDANNKLIEALINLFNQL